MIVIRASLRLDASVTVPQSVQKLTFSRSSFPHYPRLYTVICAMCPGTLIQLHLTILRLTAHHSEKNEMVQQAQRMITTIKQMEASLEDKKSIDMYQDDRTDLTVTYPLNECLQALKEKHRAIGKLHQERYEQVKSESRSHRSTLPLAAC